ncbi:MAG TPA: DNA polymerase IV [Firmicutes bacterium]|nr:DNA polymerase IV [Bacillota bacterium]
MRKIILLADMESFYASVEVAKNPSLRSKPVAVCGDPKLRHGIVLAATKEAKAYGIKTGMAAWECTKLCPGIIFVRPHMRDYIDVSLKITEVFNGFSDRVAPYSIDEQFLDMTGCEKLFGTPEDMAKLIIKKVWEKVNIRCRVGIGENPLQAKMACDRFAKKNKDGFFKLTHDNYAKHTWPLPIRDLFGVGSRMERNFLNIGIRKIGHLATLKKEDLKRRWGINGEILWLNAHGIDYSVIEPSISMKDIRKGVGHSITLPRDYRSKKEIEVVLLEITEEVCRRARSLSKVGRVVNVYCRGADFDFPTGFSRQVKMSEPTAVTMDVYPYVLKLFYAYWDRKPVRALGISLSGLTDLQEIQLSLFDKKEEKIALSKAVDSVRKRYGITSIFRLASLSQGGLLFDRANKIGGHEA